MTQQPSEPPARQNKRGDHDSDSNNSETRSTIDPESWAYWDRACAALPPMTPEQIATVAVILRRIDARRGQQPPR